MNIAVPVQSRNSVDDAFYAKLVSAFSTDCVIITNREGKTEWVNSAFTDMTGYTLAEAYGSLPCVLMQGPETNTETMRSIQHARKYRQRFQAELLQYTRSNQPFWVELCINPVFDENGVHTHFVETERDITERKRLEEKYIKIIQSQKSKETERKLVAQTVEWLYSAKSLPELLRVIEASMRKIFQDAAGELYVYSNSRDTLDLVAHWGSDVKPAAHIAPDSCWALRRGRLYSYGTSEIGFPCDHNHDEEYPSFCLPIMAYGETIGLLHLCFKNLLLSEMTKEDIETELATRRDLALLCAEQISLSVANVQLRQELQDQSTRDSLTSLWNRRWFLNEASRELRRASALNAPVALISLDVDHFKKFNDHHGHDAGDIVLREFGQVMHSVFHDGCYACRIGGEEFVVLCPGYTLEQAAAKAEEFRVAISSHEVAYGRSALPQITVSVGVATYPDHGAKVIDVLRVADECLYRAKQNGRNQIVLPSEKGNSDLRERQHTGAP